MDVVIVHMGYKDYLRCNLEITGKNNRIYLIGDESVRKLGKLKNVKWVDIEKYRGMDRYRNYYDKFENYSSNSKDFEFFCFMRVFVINEFMRDYNLSRVFHIDSDNIIMMDINKYPFHKKCAFYVSQNKSKDSMGASIHIGLINREFCEKFERLFNDIYINGSKFNLIEKKISAHRKDGEMVGGGVCDMTLYYLMSKLKMLDYQNLAVPVKNGDKRYVFMNNIRGSGGYLGGKQYRVDGKGVIEIKKGKQDNFIYDEIEKRYDVICNIHFQGGMKKFMGDKLKKEIFY